MFGPDVKIIKEFPYTLICISRMMSHHLFLVSDMSE